MDMSFANQFMAHLSLVTRHKSGEKIPIEVMDIPEEQDEFVAKTKIEMGIL
jgi:adenosylhomocysteinase (EC 3.3.1.1)